MKRRDTYFFYVGGYRIVHNLQHIGPVLGKQDDQEVLRVLRWWVCPEGSAKGDD